MDLIVDTTHVISVNKERGSSIDSGMFEQLSTFTDLPGAAL